MTGKIVHIPTLETGRLILRAHRPGDFEAYVTMFASSRAAHMGILKRREAWYSFSSDVAGWMLRGYGLWAIDLKDGTHIGQTGIQHPDHFPEPEIGWMLYDGHEGHGYATEAAMAALTWARDRVASLVSYISPGNRASIALAERLGASKDAAAARPVGESREDTLVYRHWGQA